MMKSKSIPHPAVVGGSLAGGSGCLVMKLLTHMGLTVVGGRLVAGREPVPVPDTTPVMDINRYFNTPCKENNIMRKVLLNYQTLTMKLLRKL